MSAAAIVLALAVTSSLLGLGFGIRVLGLSPARVPAAAKHAVEILGFGLGFFVLNVVIGFTTALVARSFVGFVSLYLSNDIVLLLLSLFQGLVFAGWRRSAASYDARNVTGSDRMPRNTSESSHSG